MIRIVFITTNDGHSWGGCDELWYHSARLLLKDNQQVAVSIKDWDPMPRQIEDLRKKGALIHTRSYKKKFNSFKSAFNALVPSFLRLKNESRYYRVLDDFKPDLAVISQGNNVQGKDWMEACNIRNVKYVPIVHLVSEHNWPDDQSREQLANLYRSAIKSLFVSRENLRLTEMMLATRLENAAVVDNPLNVPFDARPAYPENNNGFSLAYVGRLSIFHKGLDILLGVMAMEKWKARPIEIVLYGNGENKGALEELIKKLDVSHIKFGGYVQQIEKIWERHHGLVCPSRIEGMPMVVVEAMLCNRFCVATNVGIVPELITDDENGFIVRAAEVEFLDEALEKAWSVRDNWEKLGEKAGVKVRKRISQNPVGNFVNLLKEVTH